MASFRRRWMPSLSPPSYKKLGWLADMSRVRRGLLLLLLMGNQRSSVLAVVHRICQQHRKVALRVASRVARLSLLVEVCRIEGKASEPQFPSVQLPIASKAARHRSHPQSSPHSPRASTSATWGRYTYAPWQQYAGRVPRGPSITASLIPHFLTTSLLLSSKFLPKHHIQNG